MKLTINTSFPENGSSQSLLILVDSEQLQNTTANKGDVLAIARIAAIGASKQTSNLIPLCHPLPLTKVCVEFELHQQEQRADIFVTAETLGRTGVEMEALTATSIGLLTIYDMLKAVIRACASKVSPYCVKKVARVDCL